MAIYTLILIFLVATAADPTHFLRTPFLDVVCFVWANQLVSAGLTHAWYSEIWPDWAARRFAIIPRIL
ncbi:unnamed protein product [Protopolystoma xenopodis]|uniref:Polyprenol reductase n=1 Tax=Protopolystoma xenopodis TaxID=117903 RepID=A0A3S5AVD4_9PLAT|nr:unnamed protein product [Protopolystoma xenopodis]